MMNASVLEEVAASLVSAAEDDYLALCMVSGEVRGKFSLVAAEDYADEQVCGRVKGITLQVISLMRGKGARAITTIFEPPGHVEWECQQADHVLARVAADWDVAKWARIGRDPDPGEVVWFLKR